MSIRQIGDNTFPLQTNKTDSLPNNKFVRNSAIPNNDDSNALRFITARFLGEEAQQGDLQQEAQKLVEKHTSFWQ